MQNEQDGFKKMSESADSHAEGLSSGVVGNARGVADQVSSKLKSFGIDAEGAIDIAEDRATDLQDMLMDEIRERPFRALGWAAAAGFVIGVMSAR